jgi:hypothetical protein
MVFDFRRMLRDVPKLFGSSDVVERRRYSRADVDFDIEIERDGEQMGARIFDVSISGALLSPERALKIGDRIVIRLPQISTPVEARVVRANGGMFGIQFEDAAEGVVVAGWSRGSSPRREPQS